MQIGDSFQLIVSTIPQNLDVWAWEKYYKQEAPQQAHQVQVTPVSLQKVDIELPSMATFHGVENIEDRIGLNNSNNWVLGTRIVVSEQKYYSHLVHLLYIIKYYIIKYYSNIQMVVTKYQ